MFYINKIEELTEGRLLEDLASFQASVQPLLERRLGYYMGRQDILNKKVSNESKPNNRIVTNFCDNIVRTYQGYLVGKPVSYLVDGNQDAFDAWLAYNDSEMADSALMRDALVYGHAVELSYIDSDKKMRFTKLDPRRTMLYYSSDIDSTLLAAARLVYDKDGQIVQIVVYDETQALTLNYEEGKLTPVAHEAHYCSQVPVSVFYLTDEETNIFDSITTLQNAYNTLLSSEVDDFEAFCDAYLILKGVEVDQETLALMRENRVMMIDSDASAEYLNKEINDAQIKNLLEQIADNIHKISCSPDFSDERLMSQTGIGMRYKLVGFENVAANIETRFKKMLRHRIELMNEFNDLWQDDEAWSKVVIKVNRNLPVNSVEHAAIISQLKDVVSIEELRTLFPLEQYCSIVDKISYNYL